MSCRVEEEIGGFEVRGKQRGVIKFQASKCTQNIHKIYTKYTQYTRGKQRGVKKFQNIHKIWYCENIQKI